MEHQEYTPTLLLVTALPSNNDIAKEINSICTLRDPRGAVVGLILDEQEIPGESLSQILLDDARHLLWIQAGTSLFKMDANEFFPDERLALTQMAMANSTISVQTVSADGIDIAKESFK